MCDWWTLSSTRDGYPHLMTIYRLSLVNSFTSTVKLINTIISYFALGDRRTQGIVHVHLFSISRKTGYQNVPRTLGQPHLGGRDLGHFSWGCFAFTCEHVVLMNCREDSVIEKAKNITVPEANSHNTL